MRSSLLTRFLLPPPRETIFLPGLPAFLLKGRVFFSFSWRGGLGFRPLVFRGPLFGARTRKNTDDLKPPPLHYSGDPSFFSKKASARSKSLAREGPFSFRLSFPPLSEDPSQDFSQDNPYVAPNGSCRFFSPIDYSFQKAKDLFLRGSLSPPPH